MQEKQNQSFILHPDLGLFICFRLSFLLICAALWCLCCVTSIYNLILSSPLLYFLPMILAQRYEISDTWVNPVFWTSAHGPIPFPMSSFVWFSQILYGVLPLLNCLNYWLQSIKASCYSWSHFLCLCPCSGLEWSPWVSFWNTFWPLGSNVFPVSSHML